MNAAKKMEIGNRLFGYGFAVKCTFLACYANTLNPWFILPAFLGLCSVLTGLAFREWSKNTNKYNMYYGVHD